MWFVDGSPEVSASILGKYLKQYYDGLYLTNLKEKPKPTGDFTQVSIRKVVTQSGDNQTFEATIATLDFLTGKPINFFARFHVRTAVGDHTVFLNEISPRAYSYPVWGKMDNVIQSFKPGNYPW